MVKHSKENKDYNPIDIPNEEHKIRLVDQHEIVKDEGDHYIVKVPPREFYAVTKEYFSRSHAFKLPHDRVEPGYKFLPLAKPDRS